MAFLCPSRNDVLHAIRALFYGRSADEAVLLRVDLGYVNVTLHLQESKFQ